jgi:hypothetical protein
MMTTGVDSRLFEMTGAIAFFLGAYTMIYHILPLYIYIYIYINTPTLSIYNNKTQTPSLSIQNVNPSILTRNHRTDHHSNDNIHIVSNMLDDFGRNDLKI